MLGASAVFINSARLALSTGPQWICSASRSSLGADAGYGTLAFANSCSPLSQPALQREIAKLHSFESDVGAFTSIAYGDPTCAIAWWGAAMSARGNPLGGSLDDESLKKGRLLIERALAAKPATKRESGLIDALAVYYQPYKNQIARGRAYAAKMDALRAAYPADPDIGALDGLAILEGVDLNDKSYALQKRAGDVLEAVIKAHPDHPGASHYLIHAYDYAALAPMAAQAAETLPVLAPASSHSQHMPSHIWSMLGEWDKSIAANRKSSYIADPSSAHGAISGDIVFEHAFDFTAYARLQKGEDRHVAEDLAAARKKGEAPLIVDARYRLERGDWASAAKLAVPSGEVFDAALARFTRAYGAARSGDARKASSDLQALKRLRPSVAAGAGEYWGVNIDIYAKAAEAWMLEAEGKEAEALELMKEAAAQDDGHEKHIYLENKILPMRESLADMELSAGRAKEALADYEASLKLAPNRYRALLGAAEAARAVGDKEAARQWFEKLLDLSKDGDKTRPGVAEAEAFLAAKG